MYVVRNPKDVAVSFYYHSCSKLNYQGSWDEFFELFISGQVTLAKKNNNNNNKKKHPSDGETRRREREREKKKRKPV